MLKVLHTADWHLGQAFCGFDRDEEHSRFLDWLLSQLWFRQPDVLLISGDIFDSVNPSALAQQRYYSFLAKAHESQPALQIVITAGNHDAAARLEAPAGLLDTLNIRVVGTVQRKDNGDIDLRRFLVPITDADDNVTALVLAVPFLRPSDVPLLPNAADPYLDGVRELYRQVTEAAVALRDRRYPDAALIAMGHCHLYGGSESPESERRLVVGGAEAIAVNVFDSQIAYVALGHLHRAQKFDDGRVRYSGSPIPLSFAESGYRHQILQITLEGRHLSAVDEVQVPRTTSFIRVPESSSLPVEDLLPQLQNLELDVGLPLDQQPFLEVRVREEGPDPTRRTRIEQALEDQPIRLASIKTDRVFSGLADGVDDGPTDVSSLKDVQPVDVFLDAYREQYGTEPDDAVMKALHEILLQESHA